ncbi:hypothetical protein BRYFOR_09565 [Marvinbryantia formatexigens DSM 14469]|uniref:Uncharacterized protein n=1 Tax=Marvinbryantia formatexigens DSM 14469 TaxID=478749 RepID=C6LLL7_9FIRM|nr:hypothetical protein BRYFOR_09565 [Marvinbryantia formatexigens DSM 14469]
MPARLRLRFTPRFSCASPVKYTFSRMFNVTVYSSLNLCRS